MRRDYLLDIKLISGQGYSTPICDDEWNIIVSACKNTLDGWIIPAEVLEELWLPEFINRVEQIIVRKI